MFRTVRVLARSTTIRLIASLILATSAAMALYAVVTVRIASREWRNVMNSCADRTSELVESATHYAMLLNRKEGVHLTVRRIAEEPAVHGIRVFDKHGRVTFSTDDAEVGRTVDLEAEACVVCHESEEPLSVVPAGGRSREYRDANGEEIIGVINPIRNEPDCARSGCHPSVEEQSILGVLDVQMSVTSITAAFEEQQRRLLWALVPLLLLVAFGCAVLVYRMVWRSVRELAVATQRVAQGDLTTRVPVRREDELGQLKKAFNNMTGDLQQARTELTGWSRKLENKVVEKTEELGRVQRQVLHMEKMASLGKLAATVAHELNNPLSGILTYAKLVQRTLNEADVPVELNGEIRRYLELIQKESTRLGVTVKNLLLFARHSDSEMSQARLGEIVDRAVMLVQHHLEMCGAEVVIDVSTDDDRLICDASQLEQALVALLVNAAEALQSGHGGRLVVRAHFGADTVRLEVEDEGIGISPDVLPNVFEPFFSTKHEESGVGLGLAVVYGIVERHGGTIEVTSEFGQGTRFTISLPRKPEPADPMLNAAEQVPSPEGVEL